MKIISTIFALIVIALVAPQKIQAQGVSGYFGDIVANSPLNALNDNLTTPNGFVSALLVPLMSIAGLILFGMIIAGGFQMLTSAADPKGAEAGKQRITTAVIGFLIIFCAYWIAQVLQVVLGVDILR